MILESYFSGWKISSFAFVKCSKRRLTQVGDCKKLWTICQFENSIIAPQARLTQSKWWEKKINLSKCSVCNLKDICTNVHNVHGLTIPSSYHCSQLCYCFTLASWGKISWLSAVISFAMHYLSHQLLLSFYIVRMSVWSTSKSAFLRETINKSRKSLCTYIQCTDLFITTHL